jgi:serine/threonine protein kinase
LLTDYIPGTSLYRLLRFGKTNERDMVALADQVAAIWQRLDELHVQHNDFKTENFLVDPQGKLWLIDLERTRKFRSVVRLRKKQQRDINDFFHPRNWRTTPEAVEFFHDALLRTPAIQQAVAKQGDTHPLRRPPKAANAKTQLATVVIPTFNNADTIVATLESVHDMADEIVVADAGSTDDTLSVVQEFGGCRIVEEKFANATDFAAWADSEAKHPWIFRVMPDEHINSELSREVQDRLATNPAQDGFYITRMTCFRGRQLRHGDVPRSSSIRLYRKSAAKYELRDSEIEVCISQGATGRLEFPIEWESCWSIERYLIDAFQAAKKLAERARTAGDQANLGTVLWRAPFSFIQSYLYHGGFLDGWAGLHATFLTALGIYLREALLWDLRQPADTTRSSAHENLKVFVETSTDQSVEHAETQPIKTAA